MTEFLYQADRYAPEADAVVQAHGDGATVILDRTVLYPGGGGQPFDTGQLVWEGSTARIVWGAKAGEREDVSPERVAAIERAVTAAIYRRFARARARSTPGGGVCDP